MSEPVACPPSPTPSVSLLEIKAETRLVLKSFLHQSLSIPLHQRPGSIGGAYYDHTKYSASLVERQKKGENGWDSLDEEISAAEEKKHGIKNLIKRRLWPRPNRTRRVGSSRAPDRSPSSSLKREGQSSQSEKAHSSKKHSIGQPGRQQEILEDEALPQSSTSEEEGERKSGDKKKKKKKKLKHQLSDIFQKVNLRPQRPSSLSINKRLEQVDPVPSPTHLPEFYDEVAETLDKIAQRSVKNWSPVEPEVPPNDLSPASDKDTVIRQLVQILCTEGDIINEKIKSNTFLRSSLNRLSYPSFAKLLDTCANQTESPPLPAPCSPTLRRVAITMEVSRRMFTAHGIQHRFEGYAERYMENFAPWVKSQGGWESIVQLNEDNEFD